MFERMKNLKKNHFGLDDLAEKVVGIFVALLIAAVIGPIAFNQIANASMPKVNSAVVVMFVILLPVIAIIAVILHMVRKA